MTEWSKHLPSQDEIARLATSDRYKLVLSPTEHALEDFAQLACEIFELPMCMITIIERENVFIKASVAFTSKKSFSRGNYPIGQLLPPDKVTFVTDDSQSMHFSTAGDQQISFCAGTALITSDKQNIGSLWMMDSKPSEVDQKKQDLLLKFAQVLIDRLKLWIDAEESESIKIDHLKLVSENEAVAKKNSHLIEYQNEISHANNVLEKVLDSYEMIFQQAPIAMGICACADKNIWQANGMLQKSFGADSLIGKRLNDLIIDIDGQDFLELLNKVNQRSSAYHAREAKLLINHREGRKHIFVNLSLQPVGRMGDEPDNIMFIVDDVSEQVFSKQVLEEANNVLINAIDDTEMGYTIVEFATGKMTSNAQFNQNYGYHPEEKFDYTDLFQAMLPEYQELIKQSVRMAILTKTVYQSVYEVKWRDGSVHWIKGYGKPMYDANGHASHIIGLNKIIPKPDEHLF